MIRYHLTPPDLLRTRFAIAPLFEVVASVLVLRRDPATVGLHEPWARAVLAGGPGPARPLLDALVPDAGYVPDFLSPPPATFGPQIGPELLRLRRTPVARVRREVARRFAHEPPPAAVAELLERPRAGLDRLAEEVRGHWEQAVAPWWAAIRGTCADDIAHRASASTVHGPIEAFADLHEDVRWEGSTLAVDRPGDRGTDVDVEVGGRGLLLLPSAFVWPHVVAMHDAPWAPAVSYPPRGLGGLWAPAAGTRDDALARLLGRRRAQVLATLDREWTTSGLAARIGASAPSTSEHLAVLRDAGLVRSRRAGREVQHARTPAGDALMRASAPA